MHLNLQMKANRAPETLNRNEKRKPEPRPLPQEQPDIIVVADETDDSQHLFNPNTFEF